MALLRSRKFSLSSAFVFGILAVCCFFQGASGKLTRQQKQTILNVINNLRRRVAIGDFSEFPPSANMRALEWDDRLEAQSRLQNSITRCGPEQMLVLSRTVAFKPYPLIGYVVSLGVGRSINMTILLNRWLMERKHYFYNITWDCIDLSCKNFLQLIWADSAYVGCAHNEKCDNGRLLCYFAVGAPRRIQALPYKEGAPCSRCSSNLGHCMAKSLCATRMACRNTHSQCACDMDEGLCINGVFDSRTCTCNCMKNWSGARCNAPCSDTRPDCEIFKEQGACRWDALEWRHMERDCRSTCGYCDGSIRRDIFHTNLNDIKPNAGFPLFRVRNRPPPPSPRVPNVRPIKAKNRYVPYRRPVPRYYGQTKAPVATTTTTTTTRQVVTTVDVNLGVRTDIPWTKFFHHIDGYDQLPGNCRGNLMQEQSCVYCTLHDCAAACNRAQACTGFSYILDENRCLLKHKKCYSPDPSDRVHFYDKRVPSLPMVSHDDSTVGSANAKLVEETASASSDYPTSSYESAVFPAIPGYRLLGGNCPGAVVPDGGCSNCTVDYCSLLCSATARCAGFSFVSQTRLCYLKWQTCDRPFPNEFTKFYQKMPGQPSFKFIEGYTLLTGYCDPVANATTHCQPCGIDECKTRCNGRTDCAGFTYYIDDEKCDLLSSTCRNQVTSDMQRVYVKLGPGGSTIGPDGVTTQPTELTSTTELSTLSTTKDSFQTLPTTGSPTTPVWFKTLPGYRQLQGNCRGAVIDEQGCEDCPIEECALRCSLLPGCSGFTYVLATRQCLPKSDACGAPQPADNVKFYVKEGVVVTTAAPTQPTLPTWAPSPESTSTTTESPKTTSPAVSFTVAMPTVVFRPVPRSRKRAQTPTVRSARRHSSVRLNSQLSRNSLSSGSVPQQSTLAPGAVMFERRAETTLSPSRSFLSLLNNKPRNSFEQDSVMTGPKGLLPSTQNVVTNRNNSSVVVHEGSGNRISWKKKSGERDLDEKKTTTGKAASLMPWLGKSGALSNSKRKATGPREEDVRNLSGIRIHNKHDFSHIPGSAEVSNKQALEMESFWSVLRINGSPRSRQANARSHRYEEPEFPAYVPGYHLLPGNCYGNILSEGGCVDCSALECARRCDSLPGCGGFTYIPYQLRRCIPKSGTCSNPTVNEQIRFYERDSLVPTVPPVARARGRNMPRAMPLHSAHQTFRPSTIFFDFHPAERSRNSLSFSRSARRNPLRLLNRGSYEARSDEHDGMMENMYPGYTTTTPPPTPPPPVSDFAPPALLDCRFSSIQLAQASCRECSVDDCAANCRSNPQCVGFTYVVPQRTCLPVSTLCYTPSPDANIVFYERSDVPSTGDSTTTEPPTTGSQWFQTPPGFEEMSGQNCWSGTIPQGECMPCSSDQCADTCRQMPDCVGFTYILAQQHCLPKSQACNLETSNDINLRFYRYLNGPPIIEPPTTSTTTDGSVVTSPSSVTTSTSSPTTTPDGPYNPAPQPDALLTTRQICYNTVAELSCGGPFGGQSTDVIKIVQAHFGRISYPNEMTCGHQNPVDDGAIEAECGFFDVKPFVQSLCNDKSNCSVFASDNVLGSCQKLNSACPLRSLYLEVTYMCLSAIDHCSVLASEIPSGITLAASSSARMGAPAKPRPTCPGSFGASCDSAHALFTSSAMQAWCPSECDKNDGFLQLDLGAPYQISALFLQGRRRWDHWISRYYVTYSPNGHTWQQLESQPTEPILLDGNWDARSVVIRRFPSQSPLSAVRYLRLHIANYIGYPAVHVDVLRCPDVVGCTPLTVAHSNATGVFAVYGQSVTVQCDRRFVTPVSRLNVFKAACLPTGWSRTEQCLLATNCGEFPRVDNALHDGQSAEIGRRLMFTCNPGYRLVGNPMVTCQSSGLWSELPTCSPTNSIV